MDDIKSVSDLSTEIFDMNTKLCKDCNIIFPIAKFLNRRAICSDCFNLERKKKRAEKTKEILSINPILISKIFNAAPYAKDFSCVFATISIVPLTSVFVRIGIVKNGSFTVNGDVTAKPTLYVVALMFVATIAFLSLTSG